MRVALVVLQLSLLAAVPSCTSSFVLEQPRFRVWELQGKKASDDSERSKFDQLKEIVYSVTENLSRDELKQQQSSTKKVESPAAQILENEDATPSSFDRLKTTVYNAVDREPDMRTSQAPAKIKPIKADISDLQSPNPLKRLSAQARIRNLELQESIAQKKQATVDGINGIKEGFYSGVESAQNAYEEILKVPGKVQDSAERTTAFVQKTVSDIQSVPEKVEQKANEIQETVDQTITTTKKVVADIKALPETVKQTAEETQQSIQQASETVEEIADQTQVLLGLKKADPKPPKTPPPEPATPVQVVGEIAGTVAKGVGTGILWTTQQGFGLLWNAVSGSAGTQLKQLKEAKKEQPKPAKKAKRPPREPAASVKAATTTKPSKRPAVLPDIKPPTTDPPKQFAFAKESVKAAKPSSKKKKKPATTSDDKAVESPAFPFADERPKASNKSTKKSRRKEAAKQKKPKGDRKSVV